MLVKALSALLLFLVGATMPACAHERPTEDATLQFWHTFNREESAALQSWLDRSEHPPVTPTILPFAMASVRVRSALADGLCPDLVRMDATRIPGLAAQKLISEVPKSVWAARTWLPEARDLVRYEGTAYGVPQSLDGLALIHKRGLAAPAMKTVQDFEEFLAHSKTRVGMLIDGYWLLPFLRAEGARLPDANGVPTINTPNAARALAHFASFFKKGLAYDVIDERSPTRAIVRAFHRNEIGFVLSGPWDLGALANGTPEALTILPFPGAHAPRGGQVLVVPRCSTRASKAWELALAMSAPKLQAEWATSLGSIPVTAIGLEEAGPLANAFYRALEGTSPLPRHARAPELFDDLSPAVSAVVSGDATAEEALAGVARGWRRLYAAPSEVAP